MSRPGARDRLPLAACAGWGAGTLCSSILLYTTNTLLLRYLVDYVGIGAAVAGTMIGGSKIFNALAAPAVGILSDRTHTRFGRRGPYLLAGALGCGVALVLLFWTPRGLSGPALLTYVGAALLLYALVWTVFDVPYLTLPAELTRDPHERSRLTSWRVYASGLAVVIGSSAAPSLLQHFGRTRAAHTEVAALLAPLAVLGGLAVYWTTRRWDREAGPAKTTVSMTDYLVMLRRNGPLVLLILAKFTMIVGVHIQSVISAYFTAHFLGVSDYYLGALFFVTVVGLVVSQPGWLWLGRRYSKKQVYLLAAGLSAAVGVSWLVAQPGDPVAGVMIRSFLNGMAGGGTLLMTDSMLPDAVERDYHASGLRREGSLVSLFLFSEQVATAVASALVGWVLGAVGFVAGRGAAHGVQSAETVEAIRYLYALAPITALVSTLWLIRFPSGQSEPSTSALGRPEAGELLP
jgi:GPH family glycoside/pentoside/hexuronide:cation symporter